MYSNRQKFEIELQKLPAGRVNHWILHETSMPFLLEHRKGSGKYLIEWLSEENQESLAAEAPRSQFGTLSTNVKASGLEGEQAIDSFVQNLKRLELYLSNVGHHITDTQETNQFESCKTTQKKFNIQHQKLLTNCRVLLVPWTTKFVIFPIKYAVNPKLKSM